LLLNDLVRIFLPKKKIRTFYDVGTGGGVFVKTFLDHAVGSWTAYGVEPTESYAELAARRLNIPVIQGFYRPGLHSVKFDLITANKVLEHAEDSIEFLKGFHRDLALDGMVYIEVPNAKEIFTLPPDHDQLLYEHLFFYSANVFEYICAQADFEVVWKDEPQNAEGEVDLIVVLKKKLSSSKKKDFSFPLSRLKDLIPATVQT
jgi:SAM-dependent methyltransferase